LPPPLSLDAEAKKILIAAAKLMLARLQQNGLVSADCQYADLIRVPALMGEFIAAFRQNRDMARDLVLDKNGAPVLDDATPLVCGPTLAQVERLFVYTCATKVLATPLSAAAGRGAGQVHPQAEKIIEALKPVLAFHWQLPLLEPLRDRLRLDHLRELGADFPFLRTPAGVEAIGEAAPEDIRKARTLLGARWPFALANHPRAVAGVALCRSKSAFDAVDRVCGPRLPEFFARDGQYVVEALAQSPDRLAALGPSVVDLSVEALHLLDDIDTAVLGAFLDVFRRIYGEDARTLLADSDFARDILAGIVANFRGAQGGRLLTSSEVAMFQEAASLKWDAMRSRILAWMQEKGKRPRAPVRPAAAGTAAGKALR
jgi:hypothetical protein